jgi:uncharacterized protein YgbK (DUF1537 family)
MRHAMAEGAQTYVVLDDDPTGTQAVRQVPVLLAWDEPRLRRAASRRRPAIHLMTNVRAVSSRDAYAITLDAARAALRVVPQAQLVLRGDSTLRGHVGEEYHAVREAAFAGRAPVLLIVAALPAAGRVTRDGVHWLVNGEERRPLHETEYARDGSFSYRSARLLEWAEERSGGELPAAAGSELPLARLRSGGPEAVADAILRAARAQGPAACAPDAESVEDLRAIAAGKRLAEGAGAEVIVRCAPTFAGVLADTLATEPLTVPRARERGALVLCGSYVPGTTRQLEHARRALRLKPIEVDVLALAAGGDAAAEEAVRAAAAARRQLDERRLALVATPRERPPGTTSLEAGARIAHGLARVLALLDPPPDVVIAKGGITSQVAFQQGLGVSEAMVAGPVATGVAEWRAEVDGRRVAYLVFPGNVGDEGHLTALVRAVLGD